MLQFLVKVFFREVRWQVHADNAAGERHRGEAPDRCAATHGESGRVDNGVFALPDRWQQNGSFAELPDKDGDAVRRYLLYREQNRLETGDADRKRVQGHRRSVMPGHALTHKHLKVWRKQNPAFVSDNLTNHFAGFGCAKKRQRDAHVRQCCHVQRHLGKSSGV